MNRRLLWIVAVVLILAAGFAIYRGSFGGKGGSAAGDAFVASVNMPLTGPIANSGNLFQAAATMALDETKSSAAGRPVSIDWNDNTGAPPMAATLARRQAGSAASLYYVGFSAETLAAQPTLVATGKPIFAFSFLATITDHPNLFRNSISYKVEYPIFLDYIQRRQAKKIVIICLDLPEANEEFRKFVIPALVSRGLRAEDILLLPYPVTETDFRTTAARAGAVNPDLIVINGFQSTLAPIVSALRSRGMVKDGNVIGTFDLIDVPRLIGNAAVEGIAVAAPEFLVRPGPRASAFAERYRRRFGRDPSYADFTGYDFGLIARDMAQRVSATATPAELIAALRSTRIEGVSGRIVFDAEGDASPRVVPAVFRSGKLVAIK